jgi:dihydroorotate dehydrogenase electron transfer subunit
MRPEDLRAIEIEKVSKETEEIFTLYFNDVISLNAIPGQYVMLWIPDLDEIPMSISGINKDSLTSVTVRVVGEATSALASLSKGNKVGIRGPLGKGFITSGLEPLLVGGGTGIAPLIPLAELFVSEGITPTFVIGSRSIEELFFRDSLKGLLGDNLFEATDDGTCGFHGYASECAYTVMEGKYFDYIYTCGPELMMSAIYREAKNRDIHIQASLERYIKCAAGLCGSCAIGPYRVCRDGPVFTLEMLREIEDEFGISRLDPSGRAIPVEH